MPTDNRVPLLINGKRHGAMRFKELAEGGAL